MTDLIIPGDIIAKTQLSHEDFLIELAVYLYDKEVLSMGKAKTLAKLTLVRPLQGRAGHLMTGSTDV